MNQPRSKSNPPHPADGLIMRVDVGDALMSMVDPRSYRDTSIIWFLTYGDTKHYKHAAASIIESYDYLLSGHIPMAEATRRLRLLRAARRAALFPTNPTAGAS